MTHVVDLASRLVAIDSVNPTLVEGGAGEAEISAFVADRLERAGATVFTQDVGDGRLNVVARCRGRGGGRSLILNGHLDTVGVEGMEAPFTPRVEHGRLYGRGAYDMKAGLAVAIDVGLRALLEPLMGDVIVVATVDEEAESLGARLVAPTLAADAAIVLEPTDEALCVAHRGFVWLEVETHGIAAHGSRPDLGKDAILGLRGVFDAVERVQHGLLQAEPHPLLGRGSMHASLVEGGQEMSSYPARAVLRLEQRTLPGETAADVEAKLRAEVEATGTDAEVRTLLSRPAYESPSDSEISRVLARQLNRSPTGAAYWTDAAIFGECGIPSVLYGPAGGGAHEVVEWVDVESIERCADAVWRTAVEFCSA